MTPVTSRSLWRCHESDGVAVALRDLAVSESIQIDGQQVEVRDAVACGHKLALRPYRLGEQVIKYGAPIGFATTTIERGEHVHSHNLGSALDGELPEAPSLQATIADLAPPLPNWSGYRRTDGRYATRNEVWILPTVGCVAGLAEALAREASVLHGDCVDGIYGFGHPHGCSQLGEDLDGTRSLLAGLCDNPNAGGVLLLGLGCESNQLDALIEAVPERSRGKIRTLRAQDATDERVAALELIADLVASCAGSKRERVSAAELCVGLKCGGSDAWSGITANPLLGHFSERLVASGGRVILTEIPEIFGAEQDLLARAASPGLRDDATGLINRFRRYYLDQGVSVSENPSPGNLEGGITTLEEKSLGAVQKAGRVPLCAVIGYGDCAAEPGLNLLEAPGNDAVSSTALAAAGATLILFTTGRGTPLGFPVPTIKIASNSELARRKPGWTDFDAGRLIDGNRDFIQDQFAADLLRFACGERTAAERTGQRAIAIWKRGVTL